MRAAVLLLLIICSLLSDAFMVRQSAVSAPLVPDDALLPFLSRNSRGIIKSPGPWTKDKIPKYKLFMRKLNRIIQSGGETKGARAKFESPVSPRPRSDSD